MPIPKIQSVISKILKKNLSFSDSLLLYRTATRGKYTAEEIAEGRKELLRLYTSPTNTRLLTAEDKYAMENPYVKKLDEPLMLGQQLVVQRNLRDHYNRTYNRAQSSAADAIRPRIISATSPSLVRMIPVRRGHPTNYTVPTVSALGNNKYLQIDNLERSMIDYGYNSLSAEDKAFIDKHNFDVVSNAFSNYRLPDAPGATINMAELRRDVIQNALHGGLSRGLLGLYLSEEGLEMLAKNILGIGAPLPLASYLMDRNKNNEKLY